MAARKRAEARLERRAPYDLDSDEKLDPMQVLEEAMRHFYRKAKIEESLGRFCDFRIVNKAIETAARIAREIVSFRHPLVSAIKLAVERSECGFVTRGYDGGRDARDYPAQA
jgi:hypothetical protein